MPRPIFILDDLADSRAWLAQAAAEAFGHAEMTQVADLRSARHWLRGQPSSAPAPLALVDLGLPDGSGVDFVGELAARFSDAVIIVATIYDDDQHLLGAMAAGAHGYLLKDQDAARIVERLRAVDRGEPAISPQIARRILEHFRVSAQFRAPAGEPVQLTPRELDVLRLIGRGLRVNEAAEVLGISRQTLPGYVKTIYRKLGVSSRAEAALEAARRNLV